MTSPLSPLSPSKSRRPRPGAGWLVGTARMPWPARGSHPELQGSVASGLQRVGSAGHTRANTHAKKCTRLPRTAPGRPRCSAAGRAQASGTGWPPGASPGGGGSPRCPAPLLARRRRQRQRQGTGWGRGAGSGAVDRVCKRPMARHGLLPPQPWSLGRQSWRRRCAALRLCSRSCVSAFRAEPFCGRPTTSGVSPRASARRRCVWRMHPPLDASYICRALIASVVASLNVWSGSQSG